MRHYLRAKDFSAAQGWELVAWCCANGASEFSFREMGIRGHADPVVERAHAILAPFVLDRAVRPRTVVYTGHPDRELVPLWRLTPECIAAVQPLFPDGIFTEPTYSEDGWLEDPTVYRGEAIVLGVVSHEDEACLNVSPSEASLLRERGFTLHERGLYI
jgi:hypothetical protein